MIRCERNKKMINVSILYERASPIRSLEIFFEIIRKV